MNNVLASSTHTRNEGRLRTVALALFNNRVHVFAMPVVLVLLWDVTLQLRLPFAYYLMTTLFTVASYVFNMVTDAAEDAVNYPATGRVFTPDSVWSRPVIFWCLLVSFLLSLQAGLAFVVYALLLNGLGLLYGLPLRLQGREAPLFRIKAVWWLKNLYSALFWSVALLVTPYFYLDQPLSVTVLPAILATFLVAFFVELLWDLRDQDGDLTAGVQTIPLVIGEPRTHALLHVLNLAAAALVTSASLTGVFPAAYLFLLVHFALSIGFIELYFRNRADRQMLSHLYLLQVLPPILLVLYLGA